MKESLSITEEFILMILNDQTGYFYQVRGWDLNCAIIGSVLAELSLKSRIDTDANSLFLVDATKTGDANLDICLEEITKYKQNASTQFWIERLVIHAETIIDETLQHLVKIDLLQHHDGDFYSLNKNHSLLDSKSEGQSQFIKERISEVIHTDVIPFPRDILIVSLLDVCDVLRFIFELDENAESRIKQVCQLELISRTMAEAVGQSIINPTFRRTPTSKKIPTVMIKSLLGNKYFWQRNIPALMANLEEKYGPVFHLKPPFQKPLTFVAGIKMNRWIHRNARKVMTSGVYFRQLEKACGASGLITSLDGADHFRLRKIMGSVYSDNKFYERLDEMLSLTRQFMAECKWGKGTTLSVKRDSRLLINSQMTNIVVSTDSQDMFEELVKWKEAATMIYVGSLFPSWVMQTPVMKRRYNLMRKFIQRIEQNHTPYQRAGKPRELADDLISLNNSDPQFMPEQNLPFLLAVAPILQSIYLGDVLGFAIYEMAKNPDITQQIRKEANSLFDGGDPVKEDFTKEATDITDRFILECLRVYPVVSMQFRTISNACSIEDFALPVGQQIFIVQTAAHYSGECFPEPLKFDIDRYLPDRAEHHSLGYAPYGLGTHMCVGFSWMKLQLLVTLLLIVRHYEFSTIPKDHTLKISPFPTLSVTSKLKLDIADQLLDLPI